MDLPCNCLGVATAARVPVKRYNFLVPSVYRAEKDASLGKPTGPGVDRGIKKLCEYLARNPHRVPKAARRLARRLHRDLENRRLGEVQVSVEAYEKLIETLGPELVSLLASELVLGRVAPRRNIFTACLRPCIAHEGLDHDVGASAIGQLLQDNASGVRVLGCELLATFVRQQGCSTQFRAAMEALVPLVCEAANPRRPFSGREHVSAAGLARLRDAAWATLLDYLAYEQRAAIRSLLRPAIVLAAFDALECHLLDEPEASGASTTAGPGSEAAQRAARLVDGVLAAAKPWQQLDDAATALLYMDRRGRWAAAAAAQRRGAGAAAAPEAAALGALERALEASPAPAPAFRLFEMLVEHGLGADPAQRDLVLEVAAARVAALGAGERRAALGGVVAALGDRAPGAAAALARALAADLARPARLEAVAEMLADGAEARDPGAVVQVCLAAISGPGPAGPSEDRFAPRPGAPLPRGLLAACGRAAARPGVAPEDGARLLKAVLLGARDCLGAQEEQTLSSVLLDLARSGSVPPPVAADLCEMLRCLGQFTAENTLKRLRFGIFGPAPGARESPNGEGLASFPPAHACAMLLLASVAAGADVGELAPLLEDSFAVQDSGLHVLATTYSPADVDRAAAFLAAKAVEVPLFWTMLPESRSVYRLLDQQPEHGYRALAAPGPLTENGNDHAQDTKGEAARSRPEAERLRLLYQGADLYPDELALAALPSGSFSAVTRMKSTELQRQNSALEMALRG